MDTTREARNVIGSIQRNYYLHPDDIAMRERDPEGMEALRQEQTIKRYEGMLELYVFRFLSSNGLQSLDTALHRHHTLHSRAYTKRR
jgi:hypothetical protein